jgi:uncharacterized repeat protein (TIGR03803 family)
MTPAGELTTLYSFSILDGFPRGALVDGGDGYYYGVTKGNLEKGNGLHGTIFRITPSGTLTTLHRFSGGTDGSCPWGGLVRGVDGDFYGTTDAARSSEGTVFKISAAGVLTTLLPSANRPLSGLIRGKDGSLYGTTSKGTLGADGGTLFRISPSGEITTLHRFRDNLFGREPAAVLLQGSDGRLYGTTRSGGQPGSNGVLFSLTLPSGPVPTVSSVRPASGPSVGGTNIAITGTDFEDGATVKVGAEYAKVTSVTPTQILATTSAGLPFQADVVVTNPTHGVGVLDWGFRYESGEGCLARATLEGSASITAGSSTGLSVKLQGKGPWTLRWSDGVVQSGIASSPAVRSVSPSVTTRYEIMTVVDADCARRGEGLATVTVHEAPPSGATYSVLHHFDKQEGSAPQGTLVVGPDGNFYGVAHAGGERSNAYRSGCGTVFRVTSAGVVTRLHAFDGDEGCMPYGGLVLGKDGSLYGTTTQAFPNHWGTVFKITTAGVFKRLHSFASKPTFSAAEDTIPGPTAPLVQGSDGSFFGTTMRGGPTDDGTVFRLSPNGTVSTIHSFSYRDGSHPVGGLVLLDNGDLLGSTRDGGENGTGTIFRVTPSGSLATLHSFGHLRGKHPMAALVRGTDGDYYGTTTAYVNEPPSSFFRISLSRGLTVVRSYVSSHAALAKGPDGNFYFPSGEKLIRITESGELTILHSNRDAVADGSNPSSPLVGNGLVLGRDLSFYGTTKGGGRHGVGVFYRLTLSDGSGLPTSGTAGSAGRSLKISAPLWARGGATGLVASVPATIAGATYTWTITNGTITAGAGTRTITFSAGPSDTAHLQVTVASDPGRSGSSAKIYIISNLGRLLGKVATVVLVLSVGALFLLGRRGAGR